MNIDRCLNELEAHVKEIVRNSPSLISDEDITFEGFPSEHSVNLRKEPSKDSGFPEQNLDSPEDSSSSKPLRSTNPVVLSSKTVHKKRMSTINTAALTHTAKFAGNVDNDDPDKHKIENYSVEHFLADVESRIASRGIEEETDKIKEALVFVHPDKGDAHTTLISSIFKNVTTWTEFKNKCRTIWQTQDHKDKFFNLQQLRTLQRGRSDCSYMVEIRNIIDRIADDIQANTHMTKWPGGPRDQLVDLRQVLTYVSYGTIYTMFPDEFKLAFRKIPLDPEQDHLVLLSQLRDKVTEIKIRKEGEFAAVARHMQQTGEKPRSSTNVTEKSHNNPKSSNHNSNFSSGNYRNRSGRGNFRGSISHSNQRGNQNDNQNSYQNVGYQNNNYNRNKRGRGYHSNNGNRSGMECKKCGRNNHWTNACRMCECCGKVGHNTAECYYRQGNNNQRSQNPTIGQGQGQV